MSGNSRLRLKKRIGKRIAERLVKKVTSPPLFELMGEIEAKHPKQARFIASPARHLGMVGGIGSGKSQGGAIRALRATYGWVGERRIQTPNLGVVTAPTYPMLRDASLRTFMEIAGDYVKDHNKSDGVTLMKNGSEILWRSVSNPDSLRGPNASWWWGDESAMYPADARKIMIGRLRQFGQMGDDWETTTPKGRNRVWQDFIRDNKADIPELATAGWEMIRVSSYENGFVDPEFYADLARNYHGDFAKQELEGLFVAFEGLIYHLFDRKKHVRGSGFPDHYVRIVVGVDWGYTNPGVMIVVGFDGDGRAYVLEEVYKRRTRIEEWALEASRLRNKWGVETFYCDPSEPEYIRALNARPGVEAVQADNRVNPGIQAVQARLVVREDNRPRLRIHPEAGNVITEFEQYQWATNRDGTMRDVVNKVNDHAMDALRYAIMGQYNSSDDDVVRGRSYVN